MPDQPIPRCPVCIRELQEYDHRGDRHSFVCFFCGSFSLSGTALDIVRRRIDEKPGRKWLLSHYIRKMQDGDAMPYLNSDTCERVFATGSLPTPQEQCDNLARWLGDNSHGPGEAIRVAPGDHGAIIGVKSEEGFWFIVRGMEKQGLISYGGARGNSEVVLTFDGWTRYEELRRGTPSGYKAFMAMKFGEEPLGGIVREHFRPAVAATGFALERLDDNPIAGLIDDRLRVEIKACRFLIADLTHANNGAYWEAGYAEGLGKPVIYTCEKTMFDDKAKGTHFDTNHHLTVIWTAEHPVEAADKLKATIRATIPEAKREG